MIACIALALLSEGPSPVPGALTDGPVLTQQSLSALFRAGEDVHLSAPRL